MGKGRDYQKGRHYRLAVLMVLLALILLPFPYGEMAYARGTNGQAGKVVLETADLRLGNTQKIVLPPEVPADSQVAYQSKDERVASVIRGVIVAYGPGQTVISITASHGDKVWQFEQGVIVRLSPLTLRAYENNSYLVDAPRVLLPADGMTVAKGKTARFRAVVGKGCLTGISFSSSNGKVATAEQDGAYCKVTGVGTGKAEITVTYKIGTQSKQCIMKVTVTKPKLPIGNPKSKKIKKSTEWQGDYVYFGRFEQDNDLSNGSEMILWRVLQVTDTSVLLLADSCLVSRPYQEFFEGADWEHSDIRTWLNQDFKKRAFTGAEADALVKNEVITKTDPMGETGDTVTTYDYVYLLSSEEASSPAYGFYASMEAAAVSRQARATEYAKANDGFTNSNGYACWWLRDNGLSRHFAANVLTAGGVTYQYFIGRRNDGVRPVICLDLGKISFAVSGDGYPVAVVD